MRITGPQRGSTEQIVGQFYVTNNEWTSDFTAGTRGMNLKGLVTSLTLSTASAGDYLGMACNIGQTAPGYCPISPLGVLISDMILGVDNLVNVWVNIILYGHCERILTTGSGAVGTNDVLLYDPNLSGQVLGLTVAELAQQRKIQGVVRVFPDAAHSEIDINLEGVNTGTLGVPPYTFWEGSPHPVGLQRGVGNTAQDLGPDMTVIGYHYIGDVEIVPDEIAAGRVTGGAFADDYRQVKGFVSCLGANAGRVG